jgi:hypothetical protein
MSDRKKDPVPTKRPLEERRRRFGWVGDDVLHLEIDGEKVQSTPPEADPQKPETD